MFPTAGLALLVGFLLCLQTLAAPLTVRSDNTFTIRVTNKCNSTKSFALYSITSDWQMLQQSAAVTLATGGKYNFTAPYLGTGMRLSGHAEWGVAGQWNAQALFEFGYSAWNGIQGTAYDISLMTGSDPDVGLAAWAIDNGQGSRSCERKACLSPSNCPADQGWTNPDQVSLGSPADTVCYHGKTDFRVVFCPTRGGS